MKPVAIAQLIAGIQTECQLTELTKEGADTIVTGCYSGDLLSDVLAHAKAGQLLVTVQAHVNTVAVAEAKKMPAVIFCNNRLPAVDVIQMAEQRGIRLFSTPRTPFETDSAVAQLLLSSKG